MKSLELPVNDQTELMISKDTHLLYSVTVFSSDWSRN